MRRRQLRRGSGSIPHRRCVIEGDNCGEDQEASHIVIVIVVVIVIVTDENFHPLSPGTNRGDAAATKERASSNLPQKSKGVRVGVGEWFPKQTQFSRFLVGCYRVLLIDGVW